LTVEETTHITATCKPIEQLLADLSDKHGETRQDAREALVALGELAVPGLLPLLSSGDDQTRWEAAKALCEIHSPASAAGLVTALEDREFGVRWLAAEGLSATGHAGLPPLLQALSERPGSLRLREGAHHVLNSIRDSHTCEIVRPVLLALEEPEPDLTAGPAAHAALATLGAA
jgi:HEAT repeat protein